MNVYETVFGNDDEANDIYQDCASRHPSYHWPEALAPEMYDRSIYNCILCEMREDVGCGIPRTIFDRPGLGPKVPDRSIAEDNHVQGTDSDELLRRSSENGFIVLCADIKGMIGNGDTAEEAITDLRCGIIYRLCDNDGGIYVGTSDYAFQEAELRKFEEDLAIDDVYIVHKTHIQLAVVEEYPRYCD